MRYTKKIAHEDLKQINATLKSLGHNRYLRMSGRNGYQGLDLFSRDSNICLRTCATGSPRDCIDAANSYLSGVAVDIAQNKRSCQ